MFHGARILVAPLDWGLGHAARCVPVIRALIRAGARPVIGADRGPLALLREEFPQLDHVRIPGMEVRYAQGRSQAWALAKQFPAMLRQVREEERYFHFIRQDLRLDAVISDQRFGLRASDLPSVLITHQVFPFAPMAQGLARRLNRRYIDRFDRCWIPDHAAAPGLSGELSHAKELPGKARYIGTLSRFKGLPDPSDKPLNRVLAVLSGPEPQRSALEADVLAQLAGIAGRHTVVRGMPGAKTEMRGPVRLVGHLDAEALHTEMRHAELIISRAGYTTLMDLEAIGRGALLVPTPGQPEQEYLGRAQARCGRHRIQEQHRLDLAAALRDPPTTSDPQQDNSPLVTAMSDLARSIAIPIPA